MNYLLLIAPFVYTSLTYDYIRVPQNAFIQIGIFVVILIEGFKFTKHPLNWPVFAFLAWTFISSLYAHNHYEALKVWTQWAACGLVFYTMSSRRMDLARIFFWVGVGISAIGILQNYDLITFIPQSAPPAATQANRNTAAQIITLTFPAALYLTRQNILYSFGLVWMLAFVKMTGSDAVQIALTCEIFVFLSYYYRAFLLVPVLAAILLIANPESYIYKKKVRPEIWINTIEMIKDRPIIGYGLNNHKVFYPKYRGASVEEVAFSEKKQLGEVHNDWLQYLSETGLIGMAILIWVIVVAIAGGPPWMIATLVGIGVNAMFSFPMQRSIPPLYVAALLSQLRFRGK